MKKLWILLGLVVLALFVVGCSKNVSKQLPKEEGFEDGTIAGQAVFTSVKFCDKTPDTNSDPFVKGKLELSINSKALTYTDKCWKDKSVLEYSCKKGNKVSREIINCESGCVDGACVKKEEVVESCGTYNVTSFCKDIYKITKTVNTCTGKDTYFKSDCDETCNPNADLSSCSSGGGGPGGISGTSCQGNILLISEDLSYDCAKNGGICVPSFKGGVYIGEEFVSMGDASCQYS